VIRAVHEGDKDFVLDWLSREPTLIREQCPSTGMTPLLAAVMAPKLSHADKMSFVQSLLRKGADLGARDWQGRCVLQLARRDKKMLSFLLERGARPKAFYPNGERTTLLSDAICHGDMEIIRLLLEWHDKSAGFFTAGELEEALGLAQLAQQGTAAKLLSQSTAKLEAAALKRKSRLPNASSQHVQKVRPDSAEIGYTPDV
jgi:hypothetical protein